MSPKDFAKLSAEEQESQVSKDSMKTFTDNEAGRWHKVQIFGLYVWKTPERWDGSGSIPKVGWKLIVNRPGRGDETPAELEEFIERNLHLRAGWFVGAIARGDTFSAKAFRRGPNYLDRRPAANRRRADRHRKTDAVKAMFDGTDVRRNMTPQPCYVCGKPIEGDYVDTKREAGRRYRHAECPSWTGLSEPAVQEHMETNDREEPAELDEREDPEEC